MWFYIWLCITSGNLALENAVVELIDQFLQPVALEGTFLFLCERRVVLFFIGLASWSLFTLQAVEVQMTC
jgi:hypothetical protein